MTSSEHEPERELDALQDQSDSLREEIADVKDDWQSKKADPAVPGAGGDPIAAQSDEAEHQFPGVGDSDSLGSDDDLDDRDPENEDL